MPVSFYEKAKNSISMSDKSTGKDTLWHSAGWEEKEDVRERRKGIHSFSEMERIKK